MMRIFILLKSSRLVRQSWVLPHRKKCLFCKVTPVSIQAFVEGLPRLANVLEAINGTLKNVNNICTLAINSAKYCVLFSGDLTAIRWRVLHMFTAALKTVWPVSRISTEWKSSSLNRTVCGVIFNVKIGKDFGLKNSVFYIRMVLTENNRFLCIFSFTVFIVNEYFTTVTKLRICVTKCDVLKILNSLISL
jgi:hypothetical protein